MRVREAQGKSLLWVGVGGLAISGAAWAIMRVLFAADGGTILALLRDAGHQVGSGGLAGALGAGLGAFGFGFGPLVGGSAGRAAGDAAGRGIAAVPPAAWRGAANAAGSLASGVDLINPWKSVGDEAIRQTISGSGSVGDRVAAGAGNLAADGAYAAAKVAGTAYDIGQQVGQGIDRGINRYVAENQHH